MRINEVLVINEGITRLLDYGKRHGWIELIQHFGGTVNIMDVI